MATQLLLRMGSFETNSSSTHSLVLYSGAQQLLSNIDFQRLLNDKGELILDISILPHNNEQLTRLYSTSLEKLTYIVGHFIIKATCGYGDKFNLLEKAQNIMSYYWHILNKPPMFIQFGDEKLKINDVGDLFFIDGVFEIDENNSNDDLYRITSGSNSIMFYADFDSGFTALEIVHNKDSLYDFINGEYNYIYYCASDLNITPQNETMQLITPNAKNLINELWVNLLISKLKDVDIIAEHNDVKSIINPYSYVLADIFYPNDTEGGIEHIEETWNNNDYEYLLTDNIEDLSSFYTKYGIEHIKPTELDNNQEILECFKFEYQYKEYMKMIIINILSLDIYDLLDIVNKMPYSIIAYRSD